MTQKTHPKEYFGKRFKLWRQAQGVSAYRLAKITGVHPSFISNIEADRRPMSEAFMKKVAAISELNISYETLLAWKAQSEYGSHVLQEAFTNVIKAKGEDSPELLSTTVYRVPVKMSISSAGILNETDEAAVPAEAGWYDLPSLNSELFCVPVQGDSLHPHVPNGATLLVHEVPEMRDGPKYLIESIQGDRIVLKLVQYNSVDRTLMPLTAGESPIPFVSQNVRRILQIMAYRVDWSHP